MGKLEFDISSNGLSLQNALFLVEAADLVGEDLNQIQGSVQDKLGLPKYKSFDNKDEDTQAFIGANDEIVVIAFRGTTSRQDWATDLNAKLIPSKVGCVHCGFNRALDCVWEDLTQTLFDFKNRGQSIWIAGHSLGGALATLATDRLTEESIAVKGLYTFGQPKVGDEVFARNFDSKMKQCTFRFVHDEDVVPKTPPLPRYRHIGNECYFDRDGKLHTEKIWWCKFISRSSGVAIRSSKTLGLKVQNPGGILDHGLGYYKSCIRENLIKQEGGPKTFLEHINS